MFSWLGAVNPLLLWGSLAVASPIIIHLLSKRKFRIVNWAAMDFLLEADRRNRRRVRLENLILLLLRCAAMILIAMLLARPFFTRQGMANLADDSVGFERIVLLDNSPSMRAADESGKPTFDVALARLETFVRERSEARSGDTLTLLLTSQPESPVLHGQFLPPETVEDTLETIRNLKTSDRGAQLDQALLAVEKLVKADRAGANRIVYLVTDMRRHDWRLATRSVDPREEESKDAGRTLGTSAIVRRVAKAADGFVLIDVGSGKTDNLIVTDIQLLDESGKRRPPLAGVMSRFVVTVLNAGEQEVGDVQVTFFAGDSGSQTKTIAKPIPAGESQQVNFNVKLAGVEEAGDDMGGDMGGDAESATAIRQVEIRAVVERGDLLRHDNQRQFAARVQPGIRTLIVDDPAPDAKPQEKEHFFLNFALQPIAKLKFGYVVEIVSSNQFEGKDLDAYQLIFLCNLFDLTKNRVDALEKWVDDGGGLVITLGSDVALDFYNDRLYNEGKGLLPVKFTVPDPGDPAKKNPLGDDTQEKWASMVIDDPNHPVFRQDVGDDSVLLGGVKVFQWFGSDAETLKKDIVEGVVKVSARFDDLQHSPAIVEKSRGKHGGRVMLITTAMDADWGDWVQSAGFPIFVQEISKYMARTIDDHGNLAVGQPIRYQLDPRRHADRVEVIYRKTGETAKPTSTVVRVTPDDKTNQMWLDYEATDRAGLYELKLTPLASGEQPERVLFAVNGEADEGRLVRIGAAELEKQLEGSGVEIIDGEFSSARAQGAKKEIWPYFLIALGLVLGLEQWLAWWFGKRR